MGTPTTRHPTHYLIPAGYEGWVEIEYGAEGPSLPYRNGIYICRIPADGVLVTSSVLEDGWAQDEYFYYGSNGSLKSLPATDWGKGGMIWAGETGFDQESGVATPHRLNEKFFVGTESQYRGQR